jgi:hypothetical protein
MVGRKVEVVVHLALAAQPVHVPKPVAKHP